MNCRTVRKPIQRIWRNRTFLCSGCIFNVEWLIPAKARVIHVQSGLDSPSTSLSSQALRMNLFTLMILAPTNVLANGSRICISTIEFFLELKICISSCVLDTS